MENKSALQKTFNIIVSHSRQMTKPSADSRLSCFYRTDDGNSCFIGCTLPDAIYKPEMEANNVEILFNKFPEVINFYESQGMTTDVHKLLQLQRIHDSFFVNRELQLKNFAFSNNLLYQPLNN